MENVEIDVPKLFGNNLRRLRKEKNLTQEQLSELLGISQKHLSFIETGTQFTSAAMISKIATTLNVPVSQLFMENVGDSQLDALYRNICDHIDLKLTEVSKLYSKRSKTQPQIDSDNSD